MSVSKSLLGLLAGVLLSRGDLRADHLVTEILPEMAGTAYTGATIRHLLDMRAGIAFDEDYLATSGPMIAYRKAMGWQPHDPGEPSSDLRSFLATLTSSAGPHGGAVHYVSPNTDLLGWAIERATGQPCADLLSELIWKPLGAERSAYIAVDRLGAPRCAGGICATVRDLARVGHLIARGGARGGVQIVPEACIEDIAVGGDGNAWAAGDLAPYFPGEPIRYRSQWYVWGDRIIFGLGIHGQTLHVHRKHEIVIARVSSQALPMDMSHGQLSARAIAQVMRFFAGAAR
jgi:CubicO group peptidase (beta-lactamase class C family)